MQAERPRAAHFWEILSFLPDCVVAVAADVPDAKVIRHEKQDVGAGAGDAPRDGGPAAQDGDAYSQPAPEKQAGKTAWNAAFLSQPRTSVRGAWVSLL